MIDAHYTPTEIAKTLLKSLPKSFKASAIADFSGGDGALLREAGFVFPEAKVFYNDISAKQSKIISERESSWRVSCADFTSSRSVAKSKFAKHENGEINLILLNPPFSQRGLRPLLVNVDGENIYASVALAFVVRALKYLSSNGYLLAVLPLGCFDRRIDNDAWNFIRRKFSVCLISDLDASAFPSANARTRLVRISRSSAQDEVDGCTGIEIAEFSGKLVRGSFQMHNLGKRSLDSCFPLVHTSHLRGAKVIDGLPKASWHSTVTGPALLFPRVGKVTIEKLCVLSSNRTVVISDCIFALACKSERGAHSVRNKIVAAWPQFWSLYGGTGAPYTTKIKIETFLAYLDI
jgi:hypothetical protein